MAQDTPNTNTIWQARLKKAGGEVLSVIVGILLALAINEWWEDREIAERTDDLTNKLYIEIAENMERLKEAHAHHQLQLETLRTAISSDADLSEEAYIATYRTLYGRGIFKRAQLTDVNWDLARFTGLMTYMEIEDLRDLATLFEVQEAHAQEWRQVADSQASLEIQAGSARDMVYFLHNSFNEIWWIEKTLLETMAKTIEARTARKGKNDG